MVWVTESSVVFEISLTQDDDLFNFIHILCLYNTQFSPLAGCQWQGGRLKLKTRVHYQYEQLYVKLPLPMHSLCICNEKQFMYYLYCICKLAVSCALIGLMPLYKNVCKS